MVAENDILIWEVADRQTSVFLPVDYIRHLNAKTPIVFVRVGAFGLSADDFDDGILVMDSRRRVG